MLLALLLLASQSADGPVDFSPALQALIRQREAMPPSEFVARVEALAASGDDSATELAAESSHQGGLGWPRDLTKACQWHERASAHRADATHNLALCYENGEGWPQDLTRARTLYARAAEMGWVQAKCALGNLLVRGQGGPADPAKGVALCREAADAGNANAQTDYGFFLLEGRGIAKDMVAARVWLTKAAAQGQANAAFVLGQIYWNGDGTPTDFTAAERLFRLAYDHGRKDAAAWVARTIYKRISPDGKTISNREPLQDWVHWLKIAAAEDPDPALRANLAKVLQSLTH